MVGPEGVRSVLGERTRRFDLASVTKLLSAYGVLIAFEEHSLDLADPLGPSGSTVAHLLAHASGLGFTGSEPPAPVGTRRIYSNAGFELLGAELQARSGIAFAQYLDEALFAPLEMGGATLSGSPAHGAAAGIEDLCRFAAELFAPQLVSPGTLQLATSVAFPGLAGVVPGFGRYDPCDWGLGFELRGQKCPHWTGSTNSPASFGHFGQSGTFLLIDPVAELAVIVLSDRRFGPWAAAAWPALLDAVLAEQVA